jgi:hypothetical protein
VSDNFPLTFLLQVKNEMASGLSQATSQMKSMGDAAKTSGASVKQSGISIGAGLSLITMNLVNTAQQIIGLKREWEDLTRKQNDVVQSDNTLASSKAKLKVAYMNLQDAKKGDSGANKRQLQEAKMQLQADLKGAKSKLDVMKAHDKYNKVLNQGGVDAEKVTKKQVAYDNALRRVQNTTITNKEKQQDYQRALENFYLDTIPTAVGVIGSFASVFQVVQKSGIGFGSTIGKLSLVVGGLALAGLAIKTNFLGIRDMLTGAGKALGDQVPALKPFLEILQEVGELLGLLPAKKGTKPGGGLTGAIIRFKAEFDPLIKGFKDLVDAIMRGDWTGAFNVILNAAKTFWTQLKIAVPLLGFIEGVIADIRNGQWGKAFDSIKQAAIKFWADLKVAVPFFAGAEIFFKQLFAGNFSGAWATLAKGISDALSGIFGPELINKWVSKIQSIPEIIKAWWNNRGNKNVWTLLDAILPTDVTKTLKIITAWVTSIVTQVGAQLTLHPITTAIPFAGGITMMVDDPVFRGAIAKGALIIINALGAAIVTAATTLDTYLPGMIDSIDFSGATIIKALGDAGAALWKGIWGGLNTAAQSADWGKLIVDAILAIAKSKTSGAIERALKETPLGQLTSTIDPNKGPVLPDPNSPTGMIKQYDPNSLQPKGWDPLGDLQNWWNGLMNGQTAAGGSGKGHPLTGQQGAYGGPGKAPMSTIPTAPYVMPAPDMTKFYAAIDTGVKRVQDLGGIVASAVLALPGVNTIKFTGSIDSAVKRVLDLAGIVASTVIALPGVNTIKFTGSIDSAVKRVQGLAQIVASTPIALPGVNTIKFTGSIDSAVRRVQGLAQIVATTKINMPGVNLTKFFNSMDIMVRRVQGVQAVINSLHGKNVINTITTVHRTIYAAKGFHGMVTGPTNFMAGEKGKEWVDVTPMGGGTSQSALHSPGGGGPRAGGGSGSHRPEIIQLVVDGRVLAEVVQGKMTNKQGAYR